MTLSITQLRAEVAKHYQNVERVNDSVIRFTRKAGDQPFAVYYMDVAEELPSTRDTLTKYQDQIIGRRYFEDRQSLQWSNYLYFVLSKDRFEALKPEARDLIEGDRTYARKFIISEDELARVLEPPIAQPAPTVQHTNILSTWINRLVEAGIDKAILSEEPLPRRLTRIESSARTSPPTTSIPQTKATTEQAPFISTLRLAQYRQFPLPKEFDFATVNLIHGPNATGKTSLLEAIELFYCGRNSRNPDGRSEYEIVAVLANGHSEKATHKRKLDEFRRRHLQWYGQSEIKTNELYLSFSQFNFLNTDAAVSLAESTAHIDDNLSKLLVGPDTSKTWRNMERVCEALAGQLRNLRPLEAQVKSELKLLQKQLNEIASVPQESDALRSHLERMLRELRWKLPKGNADQIAAMLIANISELVAICTQTEGYSWEASPLSIDTLSKFCRDTQATIAKAEADIKRLESHFARQQRLTDSLAQSREALHLLTSARTFIDAGVPERVAARTKQQEFVAAETNQLSGFEPSFFEIISRSHPAAGLHSSLHNARSAKLAADSALAVSRREYNDFAKLRDKSARLRQELREIAAAILQEGADVDQCPLCHSRFRRGELARHMNEGVDEHFEQRGQSLLGAIRQREVALENLKGLEEALDWLVAFCVRAGLPTDIDIPSAVALVEGTRSRLAAARDRLTDLDRELQALDEQGHPIDTYDALVIQLSGMGHDISTSADLSKSVFETEAIVEHYIDDLNSESEKVRDLTGSIRETLLATTGDISTFRIALAGLKEKYAATQSLLNALSELLKTFSWPRAKPIAELKVSAESVRKMAVDLQAALGREALAKTAYGEAKERERQLTKQLDDIEPRKRRYQEAHKVLSDIQKNHSLTAAMKASLEKNRAAIESIFARIHFPAEFSGIGQSVATLVRKASGEIVGLGEISTGQRAAFGLSVFLAQNSQLTVAPPIVLIDDPIAHVDDLNSLSFLDYLREIALTGSRQIFFATANDKLATLFERKFDFLGPEGFRRINLSREVQGSPPTNLH